MQNTERKPLDNSINWPDIMSDVNTTTVWAYRNRNKTVVRLHSIHSQCFKNIITFEHSERQTQTYSCKPLNLLNLFFSHSSKDEGNEFGNKWRWIKWAQVIQCGFTREFLIPGYTRRGITHRKLNETAFGWPNENSNNKKREPSSIGLVKD